MTQNEVFGKGTWVCAEDSLAKIFILRSRFNVKEAKKATLRVIGLGIFHCYINGKRVGDDYFLPLNSEFEPRENFPAGEVLSAHRIYVPEYDVTDMLKDGENVIAIHFGGGWYTYARERKYGDAKAIWRIFGEGADGEFDFASSVLDKIEKSFVIEYENYAHGYSMIAYEGHDYRIGTAALGCDFDDSGWRCAKSAREPKTEYCFCDCPADKVCEIITPKLLKIEKNKRTYDAGKNTTGYPVLNLRAKEGERVSVVMSEEILADGTIDPSYVHKQSFFFIQGKNECTVRPLFSWAGFRYFEVEGEGEVECVEVIHMGVGVTADFESDSEILNWIYKTYLNTQLTNMHTGIPSDCPHMERRGYTGDGQLACHAAMNILDAEGFYRKWMRDIADSQDKISGHVQYTAPYTHSGGGPGGWGSAIVEVPYQFYRHYSDVSVLREYYPNMLRYFDYLEAHSERGLVISDKEGEWCLGDWCTPKNVALPAPFVNNYFYIKALKRVKIIASLIGKEEDVAEFDRRIAERSAAIMDAYYNLWDGNFLGCVQGANAFMIDIGLGDERTYPELVKYYNALGSFDTGIFGTDIVTRILFEGGDGELAARLLASDDVHSFAEMKKRGATTLWEYWPESLNDRSHNHPMFGAVTAYLFDYVLGIKEEKDSLTYDKIRIEPFIPSFTNYVSGYRKIKAGTVSVKAEKFDTGVHFEVEIPEDLIATFTYGEKSLTLSSGKNSFDV